MAKTESPALPYHHGNLKKALIELAREAMRRGESATLRELAAKAGVSHAAAYRHFPSKAALLAEVAKEGFERFTAALGCSTGEADLERRLTAMGRAYVAFALEDPGLFRLMWGPELKPFSAYAGLSEAAASSLGALTSAFAGHGGRAYQRHAALVTWSTLHGYTTLALDHQLEGPFNLRDAVAGVDDVMSTLVHGLSKG